MFTPAIIHLRDVRGEVEWHGGSGSLQTRWNELDIWGSAGGGSLYAEKISLFNIVTPKNQKMKRLYQEISQKSA